MTTTKMECNISIKVPKKLYGEVDKVARKKGLTMASFIRLVLTESVHTTEQNKLRYVVDTQSK